jgi:2-iminobutanoate/2-iminopropanoate deaminase
MRFLAMAFLLTACASASRPLVEFKPGAQPGPFSPAVRVGNLLFLAGKIGTDSTGRVVAGGIGPETRQTMENIRAELVRHGSSMDRVVKCTAFLADMSEWQAMNAIYATFFPGPKPARSALGANGLALGARVEIECIGVVD